MDSSELIELFYNRTYEKFVNKQILDDKNYIVPRQQLTNYVRELIDIPYIDFIEYLVNRNEIIILNSNDVTHFSSFSACEIEMCNALIWANNPGCTFVEIGSLFSDIVSSRSESDYRSYGESHIKAATQLGLTFDYYDLWYLSCIGYIYSDLDLNERRQLLARTIIRNKLYQKMLLDILEHDIDPFTYLNMFSENVAKKKLKSVFCFLQFCLEECENQEIVTYKVIEVFRDFQISELYHKILIKDRVVSSGAIPYSDKLPVNKINEAFENNTTTYYFFWFLSILQIYKTNQEQRIDVVDIKIRMIANAWNLLLGNNLSLGTKDLLNSIVFVLQKKSRLFFDASYEDVVKTLTTKKESRYVKDNLSLLSDRIAYSFLNPWIEYINNIILEVKSQEFQNCCFYSVYRGSRLQDDSFYITINPEWSEYIVKNADKLLLYTYRKLADYLSSLNPEISNVYELLIESTKDKDLNNILHNSNAKMINSPNVEFKSPFNYDKASFSIEDGEPLCKEQFVLEVIKHYIDVNKNTSWETLCHVFPKSIKSNSKYSVIEQLSIVNIKSLNDINVKDSFFMDKSSVITLKNGIKCVVNKKWEDGFEEFLKIAMSLFQITVVYNKKN